MQSMHLILSKNIQILVFIIGLAISALTHAAPPAFNMSFSPNTIGPGSNSILTFTIDNSSEATSVSNLSFTNTLPAGMTIANPSSSNTNCFNGALSAVAGADYIAMSNYRLGAGNVCTLTLEVTSSVVGAYVNTSGILSTSAGDSGTTNATLTVDGGRAGISMSFSPNPINKNAISTLTYNINNSLSGANQNFLLFNNTLPAGLLISDQPNSTTTCTGGPLQVKITGIPRTNSIKLEQGYVAAGSSCSVSIDVIAAASGVYTNKLNDLSSNGSNKSGNATALLNVVNPFLNANFPTSVIPGSSVVLTYTLSNSSRDNSAENISFTNDLNATLSGLSATTLPVDDFCGTGSTITGNSSLTITGANLAVGDSCTFDVTVLIPVNAAIGSYTNTTSIVNLTLGSVTTKPALSHPLIVDYAPQLGMSFINNPVSAGDDVTLRFTLTNPDQVNQLSDLAFTQSYSESYSGMTLKTLPAANNCGTGSTFTNPMVNQYQIFQLTGGVLDGGGSCTFDVIYTLPARGPTGSFTHPTSAITGNLSGDAVNGSYANDVLNVVSAPSLSIDLVGDSVAPGGTVTASFKLIHSENSTADAANIAFTIDLDSALTGLEMSSATANDICGSGSTISGTSTLTFSSGSLASTEECEFSVTLQVPMGAPPQSYTVTSSEVTSTIAAMASRSGSASDTQSITGLTLTKSFVSNNVFAGDTSIIRYTITNASTSFAATDITLTDNLNSALSSLAATSLPSPPCGAASSITGSTSLTLVGGDLSPGDSCTFDVPILIPAGANSGAYISATSTLSATVNGNNTATPFAVDTLYVDTLETVISTNAPKPTYTSPISVNINFARPVENFTMSDLIVSNGTISNFTGSGQDYGVDITPITTGDLTLTLPANTVNDTINASIQNTVASIVMTFLDAPANVLVTTPATATTNNGTNFVIEGTHAIDASRVFLYADVDNDGTADNSIILASDIVTNNTWSMSTALSPQVNNNFVVIWEDRVNNINRTVNVPTITETTPNYTPVISGSPSTAVDEDANYGFIPTMTDANTNDTHTYSITNKPSWASFSASTGTLTGTPVNANVGINNNITISVTDSSGLSANLAAFNITVSNTNDALVISGIPTNSIAEDANYSFTPTIADVDVGDSAVFSITNKPSWASFSTVTGILSGTPVNDDVGTYNNIVIGAMDSGGAISNLSAFSITVTNTNDAPVISGSPSNTIAEDSYYSFIPGVTDVDSADTKTFSVINLPVWASFDTGSGSITGTPVNNDVGLTTGIVITVSDTLGATDSLPAFNITVSNTNDALVISGTPITSIAEDSIYSFTPSISDVDIGDSAVFNITNQPSWASFSTTTGALTGTPGNNDVGAYNNIVIGATDSGGAISNLSAFNITVSNTNDAPTISGVPATSVAEDSLYSFTPSASDVDMGDTKIFSVVSKPSWASFNTVNGELSGTPTNNDVGLDSDIVITVTDNMGATSSLAAFSINVTNTNDAPVISGSPTATVAEDSLYSFTPSVSDVDAVETTNFSITNLPSWASFNTNTGELSGTPANGDVGISTGIVMSVTDIAGATDSLAAFSITVSNTNDALVISGVPSTSIAEDSSYSFTPSISDIDVGDSAIFSITNQPSWASFSTSTGALSGTPTNSDVGDYNNIVISATDDGGAISNLPAFNISVSNTNDAPVISGSPSATIAEDALYSFTPSVSDVDIVETTSFSIINLPSWASFNANTGELSGTPTNNDVGNTTGIVITVSDTAGATDNLAAFSITVSNTNDALVISGAPSISINEDSNYSFTPSISDIDVDDSAVFSITNQPSWASFSTVTGALSGIPINSDVGVYNNIVIGATDDGGAISNLPAFNITVSNTNDAPVISGIPETSVAEDSLYSFTPSVSDVDTVETTNFSITNLPSWASFNTNTGELSGTPTNSDVGNTTGIVITVSDTAGATDNLVAFSITVSNTNDALVISGAPSISINEDSNYSFVPSISDIDVGDSAVFSITNQPSWASFSTITGTLSGTPINSDVGIYNNIVIGATDDGGAISNLPTFNITVSNTNDAPVISGIPATFIAEDSLYSFTPIASDIDSGDTKSFSIINKPTWASFNTSTGQLSGMPTNDNIGLNSNIVITVIDSMSAASSLTAFNINVTNTNDAPAISGNPNTSIAEDSLYSFTPNVSDVDAAETTTFSITNKPTWASFNSQSGELAGTPSNGDVGITSGIVITVTDVALATDSLAAFSITVSNTNDTPTISGTPEITIAEDQNYTFKPTVIDIDIGDAITYSISNIPSWASFDTNTGELTGTPTNDDIGVTEDIVITASDLAGATASLSAFAITVNNTNDSPVISGTPAASAAEDSAYSFIPTVADVDIADTKTFSITNQPSWADFSSISGQLSGTPSNDDVGMSNIISITVTDGSGASASLPEFVITVTNTNDAPEISGIPSTQVIEGLGYSFAPTLNDVDALDLLTASIANKPSWALFNQATGSLTGMPARSDIKTYSNIVISVSDGEITTNLVPFSITVLSDLDGDQISDDLDPDIDGDGMSNDFEIANGLDPFDAYDADGDLDGDGISNLDEFINNSNPTIDDYGPNIQFESPMTIDATAFLTKLPANLASADDAVDGLVLVGHNLTSELLRPGRHVITWSATDTLGNSTSKTQILNIQPLANWELSQEAGEGSIVSVTLHLNGEAPSYPVEAEYTVTGSAIAPDDHNATSATLLINSGQSASINISIASDMTNELDETVTFSLESLKHAAIGKNKSHTITINEENHAPKVRLSTTTTLLNITSGVVTVNAAIDDVDVGDSHAVSWVSTNGLIGSTSNTSFSFDPAITGKGTYQIFATALDDAENPMQGSAVITITILDQALDLSDSLDSDGDGIVDSIDGTGDSDGNGVPDFADDQSFKNILAIYPIGGEPEDGSWVIETQPGLGLILNEYSSASGNYTPLLTEGDLVDANNNKQTDFGHDYSCGIFDFVVSDLPVQGETVLVVLPQLCAIPINAIYRKAIDGRWSEFEENTKNTLSSAPGELGVCPPPGSEEYIPGLNKGYYCVQLGIEDGGQNDGDGAKNGSIMDPGGIAVAKPTKVSTNNSGGALGWTSIVLISLIALSRGVGTIIMLSLSTSSQAEDWLKGIYATAHVGNADSNSSIREVQADFDNAGISNTTIDNVDSQRIGFGLGAGYAITPRWRAELSYLDLKQIDVDLTSTIAINNLEDLIPESGNGITMSALHRIPLDEYINLRFRLGAFRWQAEHSAPAGPGSQTQDTNNSGLDWYAGLGFDHALTSQLSITTEFQHFNFERDSTSYLRIGLEWSLDYGK
jgi:hypothetical protein